MEPSQEKTSQEASPSETQPKRKSISATKIKRLYRCGHLFELIDVQKKKYPPPVFLTKGSSVHYGAEVNFKQKIESYKDLPASKIKEATAAAFDERIKTEGVILTAKEESVGLGITLGREKDRAVQLADLYTREIAPAYQPKVVEQLQRIKLTEDMDLTVKLDMITVDDKIEDTKTGKRTLVQADIDSDLQFSIYELGFRGIYKKPSNGILVENLVDTKVPKRTVFKTQRTMEQLQQTVQKINNFIYAIKNGIFLPAAKGSWFCNETHCPAARECKYFAWYQRGGGDSAKPEPHWLAGWRAKKAAQAKEKKNAKN